LAERSPEAVAAAVLDFLDGPLAENPLRGGKPLAGPVAGCLGARRGIYRVDLDHRKVQVLDIAHRSTAYRRR
jgi:mRNA-degrading endonuclease RelE of RelBE toxin-antitoxin system